MQASALRARVIDGEEMDGEEIGRNGIETRGDAEARSGVKRLSTLPSCDQRGSQGQPAVDGSVGVNAVVAGSAARLSASAPPVPSAPAGAAVPCESHSDRTEDPVAHPNLATVTAGPHVPLAGNQGGSSSSADSSTADSMRRPARNRLFMSIHLRGGGKETGSNSADDAADHRTRVLPERRRGVGVERYAPELLGSNRARKQRVEANADGSAAATSLGTHSRATTEEATEKPCGCCGWTPSQGRNVGSGETRVNTECTSFECRMQQRQARFRQPTAPPALAKERWTHRTGNVNRTDPALAVLRLARSMCAQGVPLNEFMCTRLKQLGYDAAKLDSVAAIERYIDERQQECDNGGEAQSTAEFQRKQCADTRPVQRVAQRMVDAHLGTANKRKCTLDELTREQQQRELARRAPAGAGPTSSESADAHSVDTHIGGDVAIGAGAVAATVGMEVFCRLDAAADELPHERWRRGIIKSLHNSRDGVGVANIDFILYGPRWSPHECPLIVDDLQSARERSRAPPGALQHMVDVSDLLHTATRMPVKWRDGAPQVTRQWSVREDRGRLFAGCAQVASRHADHEACMDEWAVALRRTFRAYVTQSLGFSSYGAAPKAAQWYKRVDGSDGDIGTLVDELGIPPQEFAWATWLCGRLAEGMHGKKAWRLMLQAGACVHTKRVIPWTVLYATLAEIVHIDFAPEFKIGAAFGAHEGVMRESMLNDMRDPLREDLPLGGAQLRAAEVLSPMTIHYWLKDVSEQHASKLWKATRTLKKSKLCLGRNMHPTRKQRQAAATLKGLSTARDELARVQQRAQEQLRDPTSNPDAVVEVTKQHYFFSWNCDGAHIKDARAGRLMPQRNARKSSESQSALKEAVVLQLDAADKTEYEAGDGAALKHVGNEALEAAILHAEKRKAAGFMLNETHIKSEEEAKLVADYIGVRLGWRTMRDKRKWIADDIPEYDACVVQTIASANDPYAGVLFAWNPDVLSMDHWEVVSLGRVLYMDVSMLDDGLNYHIFPSYMPQSSAPKEAHTRVWMALTEALCAVDGAVIVAGDLNAETAARLKKAYGRDISNKMSDCKRPGEKFLFKLMHSDILPEGKLIRLGRELVTFVSGGNQESSVASSATSDGAFTPPISEGASSGNSVIDHVLIDEGATRCTYAGTHFIDSCGERYHRAISFHITTASVSRIQRSSSLKPQLHRMPKAANASAGSSSSKSKSVEKRMAELVRELPEQACYESGELIDEAMQRAEDNELEDGGELADGESDPFERIGWTCFRDYAAAEAIERLKDRVAMRNMMRKQHVEELIDEEWWRQWRNTTGVMHQMEEVDAKAIDAAQRTADKHFALTQGTATVELMQSAMRTAREVINVPISGNRRRQTAGERARRLLDYYINMEQQVEELDLVSVNFTNLGVLPKRWRVKGAHGKVSDSSLLQLFTLDGQEEPVVDLGERKRAELRIIRKLIRESQVAYDELREELRIDYVNAQLEQASEKEHAFNRAAADIMRRERPGAVSKKDRGPGNQLTAIRDENGNLLTNRECDEEVARLVAEANTPKTTDLEAVGCLIDLIGIERGNVNGGVTARDSGTAFQIVEEMEATRRQERADRRRALRQKLKQPPAGAYVIVGNRGYPKLEHRGRIVINGMRDSIFGNAFSMGESGLDEEWRDCVCECHRDWLESGDDAYVVAERHGLPIEYVVPGLGRLRTQDVEAEIEALVTMAVDYDERVLLNCCCAPDRCHLDHIAGICNARIKERISEREHKRRKSLKGLADREADEGLVASHGAKANKQEASATSAGEWRQTLRDRLSSVQIADEAADGVRDYWSESYPMRFDEEDDLCVDKRIHDRLRRLLTPERMVELARTVKEKLATALDEFSAVLIKRGDEDLARLFAQEVVDEIATFSFPESWTMQEATLIPKPGKDRVKLSGWREIWVQAHMWKVVVNAVLPECRTAIDAVRPWCNSGFIALHGCPEMSMTLRHKIEIAMLLRKSLHLYFQDYKCFFPSLSRMLTSFLLHEYGAPTDTMQLMREMQDQVLGCFKTARGPTKKTKLLRGMPMGAVEAPDFSMTITAVVQHAINKFVRGTPTPAQTEQICAIIQMWYCDDSLASDFDESKLQAMIDVMVVLSALILDLDVGHDSKEASKSASCSWRCDDKGNFVRDDGARFTIPLGKDHDDVGLAIARFYRYLGINFGPEIDLIEEEEKYRARTQGMISLYSNIGKAACDQRVNALNTIRHGGLIFAARTLPFHGGIDCKLDVAVTKQLAFHGDRLPDSKLVGAFMPNKGGGLGLRPTKGTLVAAQLDEYLKACGGRRGEPARASVL